MALIRLPFELPAFSRVTWASADIRATWQDRLSRLRRALAAPLRPSRWGGILPAQIAKLYLHQEPAWAAEAAALGLAALRIEPPDPGAIDAVTALPGEPLDPDLATGKCLLVAIGAPDDAEAARRAVLAGDRTALAAATGIPACCAGLAERMAGLAVRSPELALALASGAETTAGGRVARAQVWQTNAFWRSLGIAALPHAPCALDCAPSLALADALHARMAEARLPDEAAWLAEVLSWSMSWSALHGIAELKTPLFKAAARTDATADRYELHLHGGFPADGATGVSFPYRTPRTRMRLPLAPA
jgi:hypothetical protein